MARSRLERTVLTSFLDRLIDHDRSRSADPALSWAESVHRLKASVLRDLEWLLNTRRSVDEGAELTPEVAQSVYNYGLPDISSMTRSIDTHRKLVRNVEETVALFEPRLSDVRAKLRDGDGEGVQELRILIEATLEMDPNPERIAFDTVVDVSTGRFKLEDHDGA